VTFYHNRLVGKDKHHYFIFILPTKANGAGWH
jgi:hypothetical protein